MVLVPRGEMQRCDTVLCRGNVLKQFNATGFLEDLHRNWNIPRSLELCNWLLQAFVKKRLPSDAALELLNDMKVEAILSSEMILSLSQADCAEPEESPLGLNSDIEAGGRGFLHVCMREKRPMALGKGEVGNRS